MPPKPRTRATRRWLAAFAVAVPAAVLVVWAWPFGGEPVPPGGGPGERVGVAGQAAEDAHPPARAEADAGPPDAAQDFTDLALRCGEFFHAPPHGDAIGDWPNARLASEDCQAALEAWFPDTPAVTPIIAVAAPATWGEVFADVPERLERALWAMTDPGCRVADGEIRPDLAERCGARDMAVLSVLKNACGWPLRAEFQPLLDYNSAFGMPEYVWNANWGDHQMALRELDEGERYTGGILNFERPLHVEAALNARLVDLEEHARQRRRVDEVLLRTGWLRAKCEAARPTLRRMAARPRTFAGLMGRAAALGDELALAERPLDRRRALTLEKSEPMLAWLHLAVLDSRAAYAERDEAWDRVWRELADRSPYFENRRRLLELEGLECGEPCTRDRLRAREKESRAHRSAFFRRADDDCYKHDDCDLRSKINALLKPLRDAEDAEGTRERREARTRIKTRYRKQAESARMKYALAVEALAEATGREVNLEALRQEFADASLPWFLDDAEVQLARAEAERLVAEALSRQTSTGAAGQQP